MSEANMRIIIDKLLREAGWTLPGYGEVVNVDAEMSNDSGLADYVLKDGEDFPLCVLEAKNELLSPLVGKEKSRNYARSLNCRFVILSNGIKHYFWDIEQDSPAPIDVFPSQEELELRKRSFDPPRTESEEIGYDYIAQTQFPNFQNNPEYLDEKSQAEFIRRNGLRILRDYQLRAVKAVQKDIAAHKSRFLLEMATGTGKTLVSAALVKMFLRIHKVKRVLFIVDRIELERQALREFNEILKNDFRTVVWKNNKSDWTSAEIVVSTVQSFISENRYRKSFRPDHFGLVISDEAHRSLGTKGRKVFEYFIGFKLGLTATPRDYLKSVDIDNIAMTDPRQFEQRLMLDTYATFGCESGEPTFRYSLGNGIKDGHLVKPRVINAQSRITTELLSKRGLFFQWQNEDGDEREETFERGDFENRFFSENTNITFCETFMKNAKRDPYTNEIGKTLVFCVSQNHAAKIAQILNSLADKIFPHKYNSDFAVQVTSNVDEAQQKAVDFRNNNLNGHSKFNSNYRTSRTRVCVAVGMMTTGYDCTDILNICMMRPVYSPGEFIQMKGRGTRLHNFSGSWMNRSKSPAHVELKKDNFFLFDFFANYDYFEKDFKYDEILELPAKPASSTVVLIDQPGDDYSDMAYSYAEDPLALLEQIEISDEGMKVDKDFFRSFKAKVVSDKTIQKLVKQHNFEAAKVYLEDNIFGQPEEFFTLYKLGRFLRLDRKLTARELLLYAFGHIDRIKLKRECLDEEFDKLDKELNSDDDTFNAAKEVFEAYASDDEFRDIIDSGNFARLRVHPSGAAFHGLPSELRQKIPEYIKQNVNLERFKDAG